MPERDDHKQPQSQAEQPLTNPIVAGTSGYSIAIRRQGSLVHITLGCRDDYTSIQLYEMLVQSAKRAGLFNAYV